MSGEKLSQNSDERVEDVAKAERMAYAEKKERDNISDIELAKKQLEKRGLKARLSSVFRSKKEKERIANGEKAIYSEDLFYNSDTSPEEIHKTLAKGEASEDAGALAEKAIKNAQERADLAAGKAGKEYDKEVLDSLGIGEDYEMDSKRAEQMAYAEDPFRERAIEARKELEEFLALTKEEQFKIAIKGREKEIESKYRGWPNPEERAEIISKYIEELSEVSGYIYRAKREAEIAGKVYDAGQQARKHIDDQIKNL